MRNPNGHAVPSLEGGKLRYMPKQHKPKKDIYLRAVILIDGKLIIKDFPHGDDGRVDAEAWLMSTAEAHLDAESIVGHIITCADKHE